MASIVGMQAISKVVCRVKGGKVSLAAKGASLSSLFSVSVAIMSQPSGCGLAILYVQYMCQYT